MMSIKPFCAAVFMLAALASSSAAAHGVRFGFNFGFPLYAPFYYPAPVYYPPQVIAVPAAPPVYVERSEAQTAPAPEHYWYYCTDSQTYYPYVQQCASPWQRVSPRPPGS